MREIDVRTALHLGVFKEHHDDPDTVVVDEFDVWSGSARVDIAVINGELCGIEIKSDRDNLLRLPHQAEIYSMVFDRVTLVVGEKHVEKAVKLIPKWWGVKIARSNMGVVTIEDSRSARLNCNLDKKVLVEQLSKTEALTFLASKDALSGFRSANRRAVFNRCLELCTTDELRDYIRSCLKKRSYGFREVAAL